MKSDNDMKRKLVINSAKDAEIISVRLSPDKTPIAYENKVRCLMLSGLSREEAEKVALEPMDLELYYEIGAGLMAVDPAAVEFQGKPESEQLDFCSWCCCAGGCNLCADISKYNTKGLKIYGG